MTASRSNGLPRVWATMMALVLRGNRRLNLGRVDVVGGDVDIDEHRHQAVLEDGIDGGGKAGREVMTSSPGLQRASPSVRSQGRKRQQIGRGAGVDGQGIGHADDIRRNASRMPRRSVRWSARSPARHRPCSAFRRAKDLAGRVARTLVPGLKGLCQHEIAARCIRSTRFEGSVRFIVGLIHATSPSFICCLALL